ncbi:Uncharacterised protein [Bordetella pertussis]|nr:Uncharacterised protein [Bordetella pertussis]CPI25570.1 Uncharacterised protein [Bordetella pertussis]
MPAPIRPPVSSISAVAGMSSPTRTMDSPKVSRKVIGPAQSWLAWMKSPIRSMYACMRKTKPSINQSSILTPGRGARTARSWMFQELSKEEIIWIQ